jgi:stage IV sporulation protein FB
MMHVAAAALLGVRITEIHLMPFGGSARMENPYGVCGMRILWVALAGPAVNLLLAISFAALAQWSVLSPAAAAVHVRHNLVLCLFNLLPALPLDGGRILYALLQRRLGEEKALKLGIYLGWILAWTLITGMLFAGLRSGRWNLSFLLAAVFIISSGRDESEALSIARAQRLCALQQELGQALPVRIYQGGNLSAREALKLLRPRERIWFAMADGSILQDKQILAAIIKNGAAELPLEQLIQGNAAAPAAGVRN